VSMLCDVTQPQIALTARTPTDNGYVLVVHYYQPDVVGFDIDVAVTSLSHSYPGQFTRAYHLT